MKRPRCRPVGAARVVDIQHLEATSIPSLPDPSGADRYRRADVTIAYPVDAVGTDIAALMTITVGGVYAVRGLTGVRVRDIDLPAEWACHPGPQFGIAGSRQLMGVSQGPMIASIIKPSLGLLPDETAEVVKTLCEAGVDFIKDDEKLMSPAYSPLEDRVKAIMPVIDAHQQKTGKKVMYAFGISSADPDVMMRNHDMVAAHGGTRLSSTLTRLAMAGWRSCANGHSCVCMRIGTDGIS